MFDYLLFIKKIVVKSPLLATNLFGILFAICAEGTVQFTQITQWQSTNIDYGQWTINNIQSIGWFYFHLQELNLIEGIVNQSKAIMKRFHSNLIDKSIEFVWLFQWNHW